MSAKTNSIDFDTLVREARLERGLAIGNAVAGVVAAASLGIERAVDTIGAKLTLDRAP